MVIKLTASSWTLARPRVPRLPWCAAIALCAWAGMLQASPRPPKYHIEAVQEAWRDTFLYSVNENGVATGYTGSVSLATVWQDGALRRLDCKSDGARYSNGQAINDALQVAGSCYRDGIGDYAVVWDAQGHPTSVQDGSGHADVALGINNLGHVVGTKDRVAYVWKGSKLKLLGTLGGSFSTAEDINDKGVIVGWSTRSNDQDVRAFVYRNGQMKDLDWPWSISRARAVNARGHIVGSSGDTAYTTHGILDDGVTVKDLGRHMSALGINNLDQVVGTRTVDGESRAFIYTHGRVYDLNTLLDSTSDPDWEIDVAYDINDAGVIVGWGIWHGSYQPVVLTPQP